MAVSFGLAKRIIEHPSYNLGLALPFIAAFYLLNAPEQLKIPLLDLPLGDQISMGVKIINVAFHYIIFLFFIVLAAGLSQLTSNSKLYLAYPACVLAMSVFALFGDDGTPWIVLLFGALSLVFILLQKMEQGQLSLFLVCGAMILLSLLSFVAGVLWFYEHYVFEQAIASLFGFSTLIPGSRKLGWPMLITVGYVLFYAVFETGALWSNVS